MDEARRSVEEWIEKASSLARGLSPGLPSLQRPFVFFHARKAGGTSIRSIIYRASVKHNLSRWVAGQGGVRASPWSFPTVKMTAVFAGHVNYARMAQLLTEAWPAGLNPFKFSSRVVTTRFVRGRHGGGRSFTFRPMSDLQRTPFGGCLANVRPTVARVQSCWDFYFRTRALLHWRMPTSAELSPEQWAGLLPEAIDFSGYGCNNEYARIWGSTLDEATINHFGPERDGETFLRELNSVLSRISGCVIVRVDRCDESNTILRHYLPWLGGDICTTHSNKYKIGHGSLTDEAKKVILQQNYFDESVFQFAERLFEAQLQVARGAPSSAGGSDRSQPRRADGSPRS